MTASNFRIPETRESSKAELDEERLYATSTKLRGEDLLMDVASPISPDGESKLITERPTGAMYSRYAKFPIGGGVA